MMMKPVIGGAQEVGEGEEWTHAETLGVDDVTTEGQNSTAALQTG